MKALLRSLSFVVLFSLISCGSGKSVSRTAPTAMEAIDRLIEALQKGAESQDRALLMSLMDSDYVKEQHDGFLEGRTEQFLNEFFSGEDVKTAEWRNVRITELERIEWVTTENIEEEGTYEIEVGVRLKDGATIDLSPFVVVRKTDKGEYVAGLRGGVG